MGTGLQKSAEQKFYMIVETQLEGSKNREWKEGKG